MSREWSAHNPSVNPKGSAVAVTKPDHCLLSEKIQTMGNEFANIRVRGVGEECSAILIVKPSFPRESDGVMEPAGKLHE